MHQQFNKEQAEFRDKATAVLNSEACSAQDILALIAEIKEFIKLHKESGKILGPIIPVLSGYKRSRFPEVKNDKSRVIVGVTDTKSYWVPLGNGCLKIGHKPGRKNSLQSLRDEGTSTVVTLMGQREGAESIGQAVRSYGMEWIWLPLRNADLPAKKMNPEFFKLFAGIKEKLEKGGKIFIHCSAGMHRTGMITNALLIYLGYDRETAFKLLQKLRPVAAQEVRRHRLEWGEQFNNDSKTAANDNKP